MSATRLPTCVPMCRGHVGACARHYERWSATGRAGGAVRGEGGRGRGAVDGRVCGGVLSHGWLRGGRVHPTPDGGKAGPTLRRAPPLARTPPPVGHRSRIVELL